MILDDKLGVKKMKIAVWGMDYFGYTDSVGYALKKLGHEVKLVAVDRKEDIGIKKMKEEMVNFSPDLFINYNANVHYPVIDESFLKQLNCKKICIFVDGIQRYPSMETAISMYDETYVFESSDIDYLKRKYDINAKLSHNGVDESCFCKDSYLGGNKKYDLCFVGVLTKNRKVFLNELAKFCLDYNIKMVVYDYVWNVKHWWKNVIDRGRFKYKYPYLYGFIVNSKLSFSECAELYANTKICLNKHVDYHKSMNFRNFEIMAGFNFALSDIKDNVELYNLVDGENIAFYKDLEECQNKILLYLKEEEKRKYVAVNGGKLVQQYYTMRKVMEKILNDIKQ